MDITEGEKRGNTMCFKTRMIEECGRHLKQNQTNVRDDIIPSRIGKNSHTSENFIFATVELSQMTRCMQELSTVFRQMVEKEGE
jgi:hypothetical protein